MDYIMLLIMSSFVIAGNIIYANRTEDIFEKRILNFMSLVVLFLTFFASKQ